MKKTGTSKKVLSMLLVFVFVLSAFTAPSVKTANAAAKNPEQEIMPCFKSIGSASYCITIDGITATVSGILISQYNTNLQITLELQKYKKADGWYTVKLWAEAAYGTIADLSGRATINIFCDYRLRAIFKADNETCTRIMYPD